VEGDRPALRVRPDHGVAALPEGASDNNRRAQHGNVAKFCQITYYHAVSSMNISLPDSLKAFVDEQVAQRGYGTGSEYVRELIRKDQDRMRLRELLLEAPPPRPAARPMKPTSTACVAASVSVLKGEA
jgi:antitoxin ParD1/3/4